MKLILSINAGESLLHKVGLVSTGFLSAFKLYTKRITAKPNIKSDRRCLDAVLFFASDVRLIISTVVRGRAFRMAGNGSFTPPTVLSCLVGVRGMNRIGDESRLSASENFETVLSSLEMRCELSFVLSWGDWKLQDWKLTDNIAGVEIAGLEMDGLEIDGL